MEKKIFQVGDKVKIVRGGLGISHSDLRKDTFGICTVVEYNPIGYMDAPGVIIKDRNGKIKLNSISQGFTGASTFELVERNAEQYEIY